MRQSGFELARPEEMVDAEVEVGGEASLERVFGGPDGRPGFEMLREATKDLQKRLAAAGKLSPSRDAVLRRIFDAEQFRTKPVPTHLAELFEVIYAEAPYDIDG